VSKLSNGNDNSKNLATRNVKWCQNIKNSGWVEAKAVAWTVIKYL
jgi:hypothetical protein